MRKRLGVFFLLTLSALLILAACGADETVSDQTDDEGLSEETGDDAAEETPDDVELRVVTTMAGTDPTGKEFEAALEEFQSENPHVKIINDSESADAGTIRTKVNTDFTSNNEPELLFFFSTADADPLIEAGKVVNLEEAEGVDLSGFNAMLEQQRHEDGNIYAAPQSGFYEGIFVNEKLFEAHDIELPTTWELYEKAIEEFSETDIIPVAASTVDSHYLFEHYILGAAGMDNYRSELADQNPTWAEGLDKIAEHADKGAFPADAATLDLAMVQDLFMQEQAAMIFEGSWFWGQIEESGIAENVSVLPMPAYGSEAQTGDIIGGAGSGWFISTKAYEDDSKRKATVDLFNFLTTEEMIVRLAGATGQPPAKGQLTDLEPYLAAGHELIENAPAVELPIQDRIVSEAASYIRESVPNIVNGDKTGAEIVEEAAELE